MAKKKAATPKSAENSRKALNPQQELFCRFYAQGEGTFGNATLSYAAAYDIELGDLTKRDYNGNVVVEKDYQGDYKTCSQSGSRLLRNVKVQARVQELLRELLKDEVVDAELAKVIKQDGELQSKVQAIKEYNKLRARIIERSQTTIRAEKLDMDDLRSLISVLPPERQDEFYATINAILAEAEELRRSSQKVS